MLKTRSKAETGLRWYSKMVSDYQESSEARNWDSCRWLYGSRIKHSTLSTGEPCTWGRS
ncbi:MAG: hypothetical protein GY820_46770 [Gammaproteobacteria bacterium]|nr:hypothetical protein [Gammaproteobacteria bacterium]